jgi:hypothetical protein
MEDRLDAEDAQDKSDEEHSSDEDDNWNLGLQLVGSEAAALDHIPDSAH